ncbi:MAG: alpha/beta hydrolase [Ignavibacterium sp.]|nr:alpha/beta hydrolase [Ignavibacterium sp.]
MIKINFTYNSSKANKINIDFFFNSESECRCLIILVHGFKGFKDWGFFPFTAEYLVKNGFNVVSFNFSHNGVGKSLTEFDELEKFEKNTISLELEELNEIINISKDGYFNNFKPDYIGLLGHSRGASVSILAASINNFVNSLCCWAPVSKFDRYTERQKSIWKEVGYFEVLNTRTNQLMRMSVDLLNDIELNKDEKLSIEKAVKKLNIPFLIIHGDQDLTVPVKESELIYQWSNKNQTKFEIIESTGHTFDIVHPFSGSNKKFDRVLNLTVDFFINSLNCNKK